MMGKSNMPSSLVSLISSFAEVGVSRNLGDTALASQMLSWDDCGHFFRHPLTFLTFVLSGTHLVPVLQRELFLVVIGQSHLSSGPQVHLCTLPQVSLSSWVYCVLPGNPTTQQPCRWPRLCNSGSAVPRSALVLLAGSTDPDGGT